MSRDPTPYGDNSRRVVTSQRTPINDGTDTPVAGFYRGKVRGGGALCGFRIWYGAPLDPLTGEELDRSLRWQAQCNGEYIDIERVWPQCGRMPITEIEYNHHCAKQDWAREHIPQDALANPHRRVDHLATPLLF
jgi:hypothetical protein